MKTDFRFGEVHTLAYHAKAENDKVAFKNIFENENGGVGILSFEKGQSLSEHLAPAEVMVYVTEGEIEFTMIDNVHNIKAGQFLLMGAFVPHSVVAKENSTVMLVKVKQ